MSYYRTKKIVFNKINEIVKKASEQKTDLDLNGLKIQFLLNFEIGELSIDKMLKKLGDYYGFTIEDEVLKWKETKK